MRIEQQLCWACSVESGSSSKIRIFIPWISSFFVAMIDRIISDASGCNHEIELVDVTNFSYPRWSLAVRNITGKMLVDEFVSVRVLRRGPYGLRSFQSRGDGPEWLSFSTSSELGSKYKGELPRGLRWLRDQEYRIAMSASISLYTKLRELEIQPKEIWVYPNGRFSAHRAILEAAKHHGFKTLCYEASLFPGRFFFRTYPRHDRLAGQKHFDVVGRQVASHRKVEVGEWLEQRALPQSQTNPYALRFSSPDFSSGFGPKSIIFFTSSKDEFIGLGEQWSRFGWDTQYQAFSAIGAELRSKGFKTILRIHPNLENKSFTDLATEFIAVSELKQEGFHIIGPQESANSYQLASSSAAIVVSNSTIGIEALALGVPVLATANSYYDHLSSLIRVRRDSDLSLLETRIKEFRSPDASQEAITWLGFNFEQDFKLGRTFDLIPTVSQRAKNLLHFDVAFYHMSAILVKFLTAPGRKVMLHRLARL